ncbi:MAG: hypothetical protein MKZ70_07415 [Opitutales bacterium]|nr:hypothetical protein [Opitutales bacterium]
MESDDGARLLIDGGNVVDESRKHSAREVGGEARFYEARQPFLLQYYQHRQRMRLGLDYALPSGKRKQVRLSSFSFGSKQ